MKKILIVMLVVVLTLLLPLAAFAQETDTELEGYVTEIVDGGFVMEDKELGEIMLNTSEETVWDGVLIDGELEEGMYVIVHYDGRTTRSLPPQAHADRVGCYVLSGTVSEFLATGILLTGDELFGDVIVQFEGDFPHVYLNVPITVYYDGVMALSLPGRVTARALEVPELTGVVSEKTEESFLLTDENGQEYHVNLSEGTLFTATPSPEALTEEIVPAPVEWADGDTVTVYYSGAMTRSLPPQLTALEVQLQR